MQVFHAPLVIESNGVVEHRLKILEKKNNFSNG